MPKMRPEITEDELNILQSRAEARFYRACREQLRRELLVLHSVALIRLTTSNTPEDGEADFVVFDEDRGFIVIEVKGGGISCDPVSGTWSSISRSAIRNTIKDPFRQATAQKREILRQIINHHRWPAGKRIIAGHAAFFPDIEDTAPLCLPHAPAAIIGCRRNLSSLSAWIDSVFGYWKGKENA